MKRTKRTHRGFTLIELVIVITILAILASVAIPAFSNLTTQARNASVQGGLGGLRSAIAIFRANDIVANNCNPATDANACYPNLVELETSGVMANNEIPDNPWCKVANASCVADDVTLATSAEGGARTVLGGSAAGWAYVESGANVGIIYANSAANGASPAENRF